MTSPTMDRCSEIRSRPEQLSEMVARDNARYTFTWRNRNLVTPGDPPKPVWLDAETAKPLRAIASQTVFLGTIEDRPHFGVSLPGGDDAAAAAKAHGDFNDLRMLGQFVTFEDARLLAYVRGILHWHRHHQFCSKCGHATESGEGGHVRTCGGCDKRVFPRTDPAIMALITRGDEVLLARQPKWPKGMFSILAGFVEPGENLEEAVAREVREEVGLEVRDVRYVSSQPWPFPSSLMLGFEMQWRAGDIVLGDDELEEARWVSRAELRQEGGAVFVPPTFSLAGQLIARWLDEAK